MAKAPPINASEAEPAEEKALFTSTRLYEADSAELNRLSELRGDAHVAQTYRNLFAEKVRTELRKELKRHLNELGGES